MTAIWAAGRRPSSTDRSGSVSAESSVAARTARYGTRSHQCLEVPPVIPQQSGHPLDIEHQPVVDRVLRVPAGPHRILPEQRHAVPAGSARATRTDSCTPAATRQDRATRLGRAGLRSPPGRICGRARPASGPRSSRANVQPAPPPARRWRGRPEQDHHGLLPAAQCWTRGPQVDRLHLPPEVLQILLEPPPRQLAGLHAVEEDDGRRLDHHAIFFKQRTDVATGFEGSLGPFVILDVPGLQLEGQLAVEADVGEGRRGVGEVDLSVADAVVDVAGFGIPYVYVADLVSEVVDELARARPGGDDVADVADEADIAGGGCWSPWVRSRS